MRAVIRFSKPVEVSRIDAEHVFQVLVERDPQLRNEGFICRCPIVGRVIPVDKFTLDALGRITKAEETTSPAPGAAFVIDPSTDVGKRVLGGKTELWVRLRGDFVVDVEKRAIDAEFVRAALPTGERLPGGLFESWFTLGSD